MADSLTLSAVEDYDYISRPGSEYNLLEGTSYAEGVFGTVGNDYVLGHGGNDNLSGNNGDDYMKGGTGDDQIDGGRGSDTYLFGRGDGWDTIVSQYDDTVGKIDTLEFKSDITPEDLEFSLSDVSLAQTSLVIKVKGTEDGLTIQRFFYDGEVNSAYNPLQQIRFADGTIWSLDDIVAKVFGGTSEADVLLGTRGDDRLMGQAGDDRISGHMSNDYLFGGAGNDTLMGDAGDDILDGGAGADFISGGTGSDTYLFGRGSGWDTIASSPNDPTVGKTDTLEFKTGIRATDLVFSRSGNSLVIRIKGTEDGLTVQRFLYGDDVRNTQNPLQQIRFADGTSWNLDEIVARLHAGTSANDTLGGTVNNDIISGQGGNDKLYGRAGDDILDGGAGNDYLEGGGR